MRRVISIDHIEHCTPIKGKPYMRTYVTLDDGTQAYWWSTKSMGALKVNDEGMVAYDHGVIKFIKPVDKPIKPIDSTNTV